MGGHEVDRFGRHFLRRDDEIALVLAIRIVSHDHNASLGDVAHYIVNGVELKRFPCPANHSQTNTLTTNPPSPRSRLRRTSRHESCRSAANYKHGNKLDALAGA